MKLMRDYTLDDCLHGIKTHRSREAWAILGQGLWLLKASALNSIPQAQRKQGKNLTATVAVRSEPGTNPGFEQWLNDHVSGPESALRLSNRTAYNYMAAAQALGLTAEDDEEKLAELEAANALDGRRISDLYKSPPALGNGKKSSESTPSEPGQIWFQFENALLDQFREESPARKALYLMPSNKLEEIETQMRHGLDVIRTIKSEMAKGGARK